jgi:hypothetical protein
MTQQCLRCGRHERTGSYCSYCRTAEYDLADHECTASAVCPFGTYPDPVNAKPGDVAAFRARPLPEFVSVRHHPRAVGYLEESDPPVPAWMGSPRRVEPRRAAIRPGADTMPTEAIA